MNIRQTSQAALYEHNVSGALQSQKQFILTFLIENGPHTRQQISDATGIAINAVTPRCFELISAGLASDSKKVKTSSGRHAYLVEACSGD